MTDQCVFVTEGISTQDKGVFLFLHILNEILWNIDIWKKIKVENH